MIRKLFWLSLFAVAMAYLEAAVVVYLRELYHPDNIRQIFPPRLTSDFNLAVELGREAATIVMMLSVALLTVRRNKTRVFAAFVFQFGVWDLFYYLWLKVTIGWPVSWTEWDILFLIPWIWLGPWICPVLIAVLFLIWGGLVVASPREIILSRINLLFFMVGAILALAAFLQPAIPVFIQEGVEGFSFYLPGRFWWGLFIPGFILMIVGLFRSLPQKIFSRK